MEWISVKEKLPEDLITGVSENVLIYDDIGDIQVGYLLHGFWQDFNGEKNINATHWMPLPEPPKN